MKWERLPEASVATDHYPPGDGKIKKPEKFNEMAEMGKKLAGDFPFVRIDWYVINGKPIFGEITFTPLGGFINYFTPEYLKEMGELVKLPINNAVNRNDV
jgi:hypothetical protein